MDGCLRSWLKVDLLEADLEVRPIDDHAWVGLRRVAERREPGDFLVVIGPDIEVVQHSRPEPGERRRLLAIDHDLP
jgi:hypothetical protein